MKKSLIIFGFVFLLVMMVGGFVSAQDVTCTDSDGGMNVAEKGTTTWGPINGKYYDASDGCYGSGNSEHYCYYSANLKGYYSGVNYYGCLYGCREDNGACVLPEGEVVTCTDSDGGRDYYTQGTAESTITMGGTDECDGNYVKEYYCDGGGGAPNPTNYDCSVVCCEQYEYGNEIILLGYRWRESGSCSARESLVMDEEFGNMGRSPVSDSYCEGEKPINSCENGACTNKFVSTLTTPETTSETETTTSDTQTVPSTTTESSTTPPETTSDITTPNQTNYTSPSNIKVSITPNAINYSLPKISIEQAVSNAEYIEEIEEVILNVVNEKLVYSVFGIREGRLFAIIPVSTKIEQNIDANSGEIVSTKKPWWSFLASGI